MMKTKGIKEIAIIAGVSIGTVDRVIHRRGKVSAEAKKRVEAAIKETEYRPNLLARSLVNKTKVKIALIIPDSGSDEYWQQSKAGAEEAKKNWDSFGVQLHTFHFHLNTIKSFETATRKALLLSPSAVIFVPIFFKQGIDFVTECDKQKIPVVIFNTHLPGSNPLSFIGTDSVQSGILAGELMHLITSPTGELLVLHFDEDARNSPHMIEKEKGFREFFKRQQPGQARRITTLTLKNKRYKEQLKSLFKSNNFEGVFISTSKAYEVGEFLRNEKNPNVKIIGFDLISKNIELLQKGIIQFLIHQNPRKQTELSISSLCNYLLFNKPILRSNLFPLDIITRSNLSSFVSDEGK
jgi:LacI family transcriptional regulator